MGRPTAPKARTTRDETHPTQVIAHSRSRKTTGPIRKGIAAAAVSRSTASSMFFTRSPKFVIPLDAQPAVEEEGIRVLQAQG